MSSWRSRTRTRSQTKSHAGACPACCNHTHQFPLLVLLGSKFEAESLHTLLQVHHLHLKLPALLLLGLQGESQGLVVGLQGDLEEGGGVCVRERGRVKTEQSRFCCLCKPWRMTHWEFYFWSLKPRLMSASMALMASSSSWGTSSHWRKRLTKEIYEARNLRKHRGFGLSLTLMKQTCRVRYMLEALMYDLSVSENKGLKVGPGSMGKNYNIPW